MLRWPFRRRTPKPQADPAHAWALFGAMREDAGRFAGLGDARVLIYFPHGLGDWIFFSLIAPLLDPTNAYAITRFGDDYVSVAEGSALLEPLFSGVRAPGDGSAQGARHLGIALCDCDGGKVRVALPPPLDDAVERFVPEAMLWTDFPETQGRTAFPYHTKARSLARSLATRSRLRGFDLSQPLRSCFDFAAPAALQARFDESLAPLAPPGSRVCVLSRTGFTAARKNWGDGSEARAFAAAMRREDPRWRFVSMDEEDLGEGSAGFRALFGRLDEPFARLYKALAARADLFVGVPAGPLHFTMARGGVPVIGLWLAHHPDWYDEPNADAIHLIGRTVKDRGYDRRPATRTKPASLRHRIVQLETSEIPATAVVEAATRR
ncbi:MAG TPA: hypothetical protein VMH02_08800 [Verrucomicrobiae bacterium]|nr:hypothetical protein [Verrucomicrobiae bacterium]